MGHRLIERIRNLVREVTDEYPLYSVGVLAFAAFVAGLLL